MTELEFAKKFVTRAARFATNFATSKRTTAIIASRTLKGLELCFTKKLSRSS